MSAPEPLTVLILWGESLAKPSAGTTHCRGLASGLVDLGHSVRVMTPQYRGQRQFIDSFPIHPIRLPRRGVIAFVLFQFLTVVLLPYWLWSVRPDVVYVRTCVFQWLLALISRLTGTPLVGEVDGLIDQEVLVRGHAPSVAALFRLNEKLAARCSSGLVCVSRALRTEYVTNRWASPRTTIAVHNGAMTDVMRPHDQQQMRSQFGLESDTVIFAFAGSLAPWQGLDFLLEAAKLVDESDTAGRVRFAIMGRGSLKDQFVHDVEAAELHHRFRFFEPGDSDAVARFLSACDAVVLPRNDRRFIGLCSPLKFFDGISVGLPVIVPEESEIDEILQRLELPGTFDPKSAESLSEAILGLADQVDTLRPRREEVHTIVCTEYSWMNVARKTSDLFEFLLRRTDVQLDSE